MAAPARVAGRATHVAPALAGAPLTEDAAAALEGAFQVLWMELRVAEVARRATRAAAWA